ncbi:hypothetical protein EV426DRAFT_706689 [Tirmania nivea]|nr:hypothetical protein EV426DRAFT_706689 [Tirmania nivea]
MALTLCIPLDALLLPHAHTVLYKDREWLTNRFKEEGLDRKGHPIPALISPETLPELLDVNFRYPRGAEFAAAVKVPCLHGHRRVEVARRLLPMSDQWWAMDIYTELTNEEQTKFI